jgi:integrase/recombinase XerC
MYIDPFLSYLKNEKRFSAHTLKGYQTDILQFTTFSLEEFEVDEPKMIGHQLIRSWMVSLLEQGVTPRSINRKLSTLRTYFKFLHRSEVIDKDPMIKVQSPKMGKRITPFVEVGAMKELLKPEKFNNDFAGERDKLVLALFYETGMRLSELIGLNDSDVNHHGLLIKVLGKRNKERLIPISKAMSDQINIYTAIRAEEAFEKEGDSLLLTNKGKKLYPKFVYSLVNSYLGSVTTSSKKSPHVLRHTFATHMLNNGASLNSIKEILGHANLSATQVYTHNSIEKLKNIHKQAHPKG